MKDAIIFAAGVLGAVACVITGHSDAAGGIVVATVIVLILS